ncbi:ATP-binding protein [Bdellovibrio sp. HCB337]|uniref:ATP-binding protein n=1 Tax=Bdellovibrio sp. HCB337 TaxID=3394358 RepID=UPI0039A42739
MRRFWRNLSVSTKLYFVVGIMAMLICLELLSLHFAMTTLSAVRSFVGGEGLWSKAQKSAIYNLQQYGQTGNPIYYKHFQQFLLVPLGDRQARLEMEKPNIDMNRISDGFVQGQNHPDDVENMVLLIRRFYWVPYLARAIDFWRRGDVLMDELIDVGKKIDHEVRTAKNKDDLKKLLSDLSELDLKFTEIENGFSSTLGAASRWLEDILMSLLICAVITIEGTGLFLTYTFSRNLSNVLNELNLFASRVGDADFDQRVPVRSGDELGKLAEGLNSMTTNLQKQVEGRLTAEHASEVKNLFLANMSHEIRTPLNAILGFAEILNSPDISDEEKDAYMAIIKRTGANLTTIINDILDIAQLEAEAIPVHEECFSLKELISDLSQILQFRVDAKGLTLSVRTWGTVSEYITSDFTRLRQILTNILGNAIKFTNTGGVTLSYGIVGDKLVFDVADTGIGISPEHAEKLFRPFSQADNSVRKKFGGTGLGLLISRKLAMLLGGDVVIQQSAPDRGTTFRISINYVPSEAPSIKRNSTSSSTVNVQNWQGLRVLVCEDSKDNQALVKAYLRKTDLAVDFAINGEDGLKLQEKNDYSMILMDMQMPILDGFTATKMLRARGCNVPIVALTGFAMKQDQQKCIKVGCDEVLTKPFTKQELQTVIGKYIDRATVTIKKTG